jgi:ferredoxin-nitrate reductase
MSERRLFENGSFFTPDGRARFIFEQPRAAPEQTDAEYPFLLMTGRGTSSQWHTNTRTGKSDVLRKLYPSNCYVEINPQDAERLGIRKNSVVRIASRRAQIRALAFVTPTIRSGQLFIPMHYREAIGSLFPPSILIRVSRLTRPVRCRLR